MYGINIKHLVTIIWVQRSKSFRGHEYMGHIFSVWYTFKFHMTNIVCLHECGISKKLLPRHESMLKNLKFDLVVKGQDHKGVVNVWN